MTYTATTATTTPPPSPRRCQRILEAHHLRCRGLTLQQIADQLGCARSTAAAYLRDFQLHRGHILYTVTGDRLLDQIYTLTQPQSDPQQHRQTIASARELRLLLAAMPSLREHEQQQQEIFEAARNASTIALARSRHFRVEDDGHLRYIGGGRLGQCMPECPSCRPELYEGDDPLPHIRSLDDWAAAVSRIEPHNPTEPEFPSPEGVSEVTIPNPRFTRGPAPSLPSDAPPDSPRRPNESPREAATGLRSVELASETPSPSRDQTSPSQGDAPLAETVPPVRSDADLSQSGLTQPGTDQPVDTPPESGQIWTDLDTSEPQNDESPVPDSEFAPTPRNSRPNQTQLSPRSPQAWSNHDPFIPPERPNRSVVIPLPDLGRL